MCNLTVIVVLDFISRDLYLLFAIRFSSKFQNSVFYQHMRPKSGLKFPRPLNCLLVGNNQLNLNSNIDIFLAVQKYIVASKRFQS